MSLAETIQNMSNCDKLVVKKFEIFLQDESASSAC